MQSFFLSLVTLACLLTIACEPQEKPLTVDLSQREPLRLAEDPEAVTYAYLPQYTHRASHQRHHLLVAYLQRQTGRKFRQVFPDSFDRHLEMIGQGRIDISYSNPFFYITANGRYGSHAFAAALLKLDPGNPADRKILEAAHLTGIVAARDGDFDSVRELARRLDLDQTP